MNLFMVKEIQKQLNRLGIFSVANVSYSDKTDTYNFDFEKIQLQVKNIFDTGDLDEKELTDFIANMFINMRFLLDETITLQRMFDTLSYSMFLESDVMKEHLERLNKYIVLLEDHIGVEPTTADEYNQGLTIGESE